MTETFGKKPVAKSFEIPANLPESVRIVSEVLTDLFSIAIFRWNKANFEWRSLNMLAKHSFVPKDVKFSEDIFPFHRIIYQLYMQLIRPLNMAFILG